MLVKLLLTIAFITGLTTSVPQQPNDEEWEDRITSNSPNFTVDTSAAPDLDDFGHRVKSTLEEWWPRILDKLGPSNYFSNIKVIFTEGNKNCDNTSAPYPIYSEGNNSIVGCANFYRISKDDLGSFIHVLVYHCWVNSKAGFESIGMDNKNQNCPRWLRTGVADWIRFYLFEPQNAPGKPPVSARYIHGFRTVAYFLNYVEFRRKGSLKRISDICRRNEYSVLTWKEIAGESLSELWEHM